MKELAIYFKFLLTNKLLILIPALLFTALALIYHLVTLPTFYYSKLFELDYQVENLSEKTTLSDQAVAVIRSPYIQESLGIDRGTEVVVHKNAPLSLVVTLQGQNPEIVKNDLDKISDFIAARYPGVFLGSLQWSEKTSVLVLALLGLGAGVFLGLMAAILKTYLQKY